MAKDFNAAIDGVLARDARYHRDAYHFLREALDHTHARLMKLGEKVLEHHSELAQLEARDTGKPMTTARTDITVLARYFEFYGGAADKVHGEVIPFLNGYEVNLLREPLGVTAHITPWNYPAQMFGRTLAPALAMATLSCSNPQKRPVWSRWNWPNWPMKPDFLRDRSTS